MSLSPPTESAGQAAVPTANSLFGALRDKAVSRSSSCIKCNKRHAVGTQEGHSMSAAPLLNWELFR
jgi:hypothetical protein